MPAFQFGKLLRDLREQAGLSQEELASYLNVHVSLIQEWEDGRSPPPPAFENALYKYLPTTPVPFNSDVTQAALFYKLNHVFITTRNLIPTNPDDLSQREVEVLRQLPFTEISDRAKLPLLNPSIFMELASILVKVEPEPLRIHYPHTMPEHGSDIVAEGKRQQAPKVVFQSKETKLLVEALENPDHKYGQQATQAMRRFIKAVEKDKAKDLIKDRGILTDQASRKYGVPARTLASWGDMGLLPVLYKGRGKQGVYLDEEAVARVAPVYHEAKQRGEQPAKRLKAMLTQQAEGDRQPSH
jgi:transcriptional regulator with XRE-family HTH domain